MIAEQYISLKTAQMLKEAKFDVPCRRHYTKSGSTWETAVPETNDESRDFTWFPCPTQALAARWLREVYHIHIMITPMIDGWMVELFDLKKYQYILTNKDANTDSYEQAFELDLQEAIKLIKK